MVKKLSLILSIVLLFSIIVTACTTKRPPSQENGQVNQPAQKVTIRLSTWAGADEAKELQAILDKLNSASDKYEIVQDSNPADYDTRLTTQLSGSSGPDIFWISAQRAAQFAARGVMLDITQRLPKSDKPVAELSDYYEASLGPFKYKDSVFGLPWIEQPVVLYINKDLFDKAGVAYPDDSWNWDKFLDAAKKLTVDQNGKHPDEAGFDKGNVKQWGFTLNGWPPVQVFIWQNGGEVISEDFSNSPIDTPEAKAAFKFYADLVNSPMVPSQQLIKDRGFDTMFKNQQVAMFMGGAADSLDTKVDFKCGVYELPAGPAGTKATLGDVLGMGINAKTKNRDVAFEAFLDLTDAIHQWKVMPPRKSMANMDTMKKLHPDREDAMQAIINSMEYARTYRYFGNYPDWDNIFWTQLMDPIVNNHADPEELIPKVKPQLDAVLKKSAE
ncbi:ABC transporter substrate-binding protein [Mahella australiensis]|uniref:Carbohydrate ABC transporter substrate-binding protein, CUT1 family n=1 Tax=Mahella australiensis (strain DSM 15567 / CIP 107919 / 50-1 BON) TaxID=697281 RepID=F3ZVT7_MAHA5|nr:sugar ABC transporter substrate-binding protein [Mahella australiensis]AEE97481.1 carbohydrate ABC transporter substrate-binding protein, CUT1 family [Mahella australiensis 50-1 BON]